MPSCSNGKELKEDAIFIEDYNMGWPCLAEKEIKKLKSLLLQNNLVEIAHVGSTSIPNAMAKPIIDIYVAVKSIEQSKQHDIKPIKSLGYVYWEENPNPEKMFFVKGMPPYGKQRTHHIHIVKAGSRYWRDRIAFRDYMRAHPDEVLRYNDLKNDLSEKYRYDREAYTDEKNKFIVEILNKAGIFDGGKR